MPVSVLKLSASIMVGCRMGQKLGSYVANGMGGKPTREKHSRAFLTGRKKGPMNANPGTVFMEPGPRVIYFFVHSS